jgi:hypothetical protein
MEDLGVDWKIILKWILKNWDGGKAWTTLIWLRTETSSRMLRT